ncbi:MAG TPA: oligopeptidase B, partial [Micromonosporaceae bacterium]|nr:oligopeptidase B [Micromonosporaceae bacterium]
MDNPPAAKLVPTSRIHHGDTVVDEYAWLADRDDPDTVAYLKAENEYTEAVTADLAGLREQIFDEIKRRTQETDLSVPARRRDWWYYVRTEEGKQYPIHCRLAAEPTDRPGQFADTPPEIDGVPDGEQVMLDENQLAGDSDFFALGALEVSPDGRLVAYSTDFAGNERFTLRVKDLESGETLDDEVPDTFYGSAWAADSRTLFYLTVDEQWRPYRVWRHRVGTAASDDVLVYEEPDERFWIGVD